MFTPRERSKLREALIERARADDRITGAALTGSITRDAEDRWSDIDLAFGVDSAADFAATMADWTEMMYRGHEALDHLDVPHGKTIYRVFFLPSTLQVDLAFSPAVQFRALAPTFRLLFGEAADPIHAPEPSPEKFIGLAWLHALHVRSSLARGRLLQAEHMLSAARDHVLSLACLRHELPPHQGRGLDELPSEERADFEDSLVRSLEPRELVRAFRVVVAALEREVARIDADLRDRLAPALEELVRTSRPDEARG